MKGCVVLEEGENTFPTAQVSGYACANLNNTLKSG